MALIRTTLRLKENLKRSAERLALEKKKTLQEIFNEALEYYLTHEAKAEARKIVFLTHDLGEPLDNLKRRDYYS
jgi:cobalamin biosynthesis protein CbiG